MDNLLCGPPGLTISDSTRARVASPPQWWDLRLDWDDWQMPPWQSQGVVSTSDDAWCGWISGGDPADMDEFSRMRHSLIDPLHFLLFTLFGAGLLPLPAANCQSLLSLETHIFTNWHLQSWSCFPVGLHHLLVVRCGLLATFSGKRRRGFETNISGCGRLLWRSCYRWLGSGQTFQSQTRTRSKDVLVTSGVAQGIKQRCNVAR